MRRRFFVSALAAVYLLVSPIALPTRDAGAMDWLVQSSEQAVAAARVGFTQLNWLADNGTVLVPFSRVGVAEFSFSPADDQLLERNGGGYINLVTDTGSGPRWSVENLYLSYPDTGYMLASHPTVQFDLGVGNGARLDLIFSSLAVTADPLASPPRHGGEHALVSHEDYLVGGMNGGGSGQEATYNTIGPFVGCRVPDCARPLFVALTPVPPTDAFEPISEDPMGCAPAAVARSLKSMFGGNELKDVTAQQVYKDLYQAMGTTLTDGTTTDNARRGKQTYVHSKKLPLVTHQYTFKNGTRFAPDALKASGDVELRIDFGQGKGHFATVTSITPQKDGGFQIKYVDDPNQKDGKAENQEHTIYTDKDGNITSPKGSATVAGFLVETKTKK